jgi:hypothetical protein
MGRAETETALNSEIEKRLTELRKLQEEEADEMQGRFESSLTLKPGEGWQALRRAEALLARYEDPASSNPPTSRQH